MRAFSRKKIGKAIVCVVLVGAMCRLSLVAAQERDRYVRIDESVMQDVKNDVVRGMESSSEENKIIYDAIIDKAFDLYFGNKNVNADRLVGSDSVKALNDGMEMLRKEIERLKNDSIAMADKLAEMDKNYVSRECLAGCADSLRMMEKIIAGQDSALRCERGLNQTSLDRIKELELQLSKFDRVAERLNAAKKALSDADSICEACRLADMHDLDTLSEAATGYVELLSLLGMEAEPACVGQVERVNAVCFVAEFYGRSMIQLAGPFDHNANQALLQESTIVKSRLEYLSDVQKDELNVMVEAIENEQYAIKNFRNGVIKSLKDLGCIADEGVADDAYDSIDANIKLFTGNKHKVPGSGKYQYNPLYVNINRQLESLRAGIRDKVLDDPVPYNMFLDEISKSLGGEVND